MTLASSALPTEAPARRAVCMTPFILMREYVVPQKPVEEQENPKPKAYSMTCAQRLKRVFSIDIEKCEKCGGPVRIIASIEDPDVIQKILKHLGLGSVS